MMEITVMEIIKSKGRTQLLFTVLMLLCFHAHTKEQEGPPNKEIPRGITTNPTDKMLRPVSGKILRIGVPPQFKPNGVFQVEHDAQTNSTVITGYCADVFHAAFAGLGSNVSFHFISVVDGHRNYNNLIYQVYTGELDAVVGDVTITYNRSRYVDFTLPYTDLGLGTLTRNADVTMWIFLKPLSSDLWFASACFFILLGFVVWVLEHQTNLEFQGSPSEQIGITLWFAFSTLVYAQRQQLKSNLSRFVVTVWLFVMLVLASSYTATLSSLLTIEQIRLASKGDSVGYQDGSFWKGYMTSNLNFRGTSLRPYSTSEEFANALSRGAKNGGVDAIVDEIPYLKEFLARYPSGYSMVVSRMTTSGFGFALPQGSPLVSELSREITRLREDGILKILEDKWFKSDPLSMDSEPASRILDLKACRGLFLISGVSMAVALIIFFIISFKKMHLTNTTGGLVAERR